MKKLSRKIKAVFLLAVSMLLIFSAVTVSAETDQATRDSLKSSVKSFLEQVYTMDDSSLDSMKEEGGFYEIVWKSWDDNKDIVGEFQKIKSTSVEEGSEQVTVTSLVEFKNYDAEVEVYFSSDGSTPKNFVMNVKYPLSVKMEQALQNTAVGLLVVFVMLIFLCLVIGLFGKIASKAGKQKNNNEGLAEKKALTAAASDVSNAPIKRAVRTTDSKDEIIAVIAAAVAAAQEENPSVNGGYYVRSIRKIGTSRNWKRV